MTTMQTLDELQSSLKTPTNFSINYCKYSKIQTKRFYYCMEMPNDVNGIANSEDPDQPVPLGAV